MVRGVERASALSSLLGAVQGHKDMQSVLDILREIKAKNTTVHKDFIQVLQL